MYLFFAVCHRQYTQTISSTWLYNLVLHFHQSICDKSQLWKYEPPPAAYHIQFRNSSNNYMCVSTSQKMCWWKCKHVIYVIYFQDLAGDVVVNQTVQLWGDPDIKRSYVTIMLSFSPLLYQKNSIMEQIDSWSVTSLGKVRESWSMPRRWANVGFMLCQRRRRWPNMKPTLA